MPVCRKRVPDKTDHAIIKRERGGHPKIATQRRDGWTETRREAFLTELSRTCNVMASCRAAGMSSGAIYPLRRRDAAFRAAWDEALLEGYRNLELTMLDRAINGMERPVWYGGKQIGSEQHFSDALGMNLLGHHRAVAVASSRGVAEPGIVEEARLKIETRVKAIKLRSEKAVSRAKQSDG